MRGGAALAAGLFVTFAITFVLGMFLLGRHVTRTAGVAVYRPLRARLRRALQRLNPRKGAPDVDL